MNRRRSEAGLVAVIAGVCAAGIVAATRSSYFYADDWLNLAQARELGMSWDYLQLSYFGANTLRRAVDNGREERPGLVRVGVRAPEHVAAAMKGLRALELRLPAGVCVHSLTTVLAD